MALVPNSELQLFSAFNVQNEDDEFEIPLPRPCMSYDAMANLYEMRDNNQLCDSAIRLEDGSLFKVHGALFCGCSSYFKALFTSPLNQSEIGNEFFIAGVSKQVMENIIKYVYLRDCSFLNDSNVYEIYVISDYFGINGLMKVCVDFIITLISPKNCIALWLFARFRSMSRLSEKTWNFILGEFTQVAAVSEEILQLEVDDLFTIINDEVLNVKDESVVWELVLKWIEVDSSKRLDHLPKLMRGVRLGLMSNTYFMEKVKAHKYVENNTEIRPIVIETLKFLCDLETLSTSSKEILTPSIAIPRLPHEIIFAIGGWSEGAPQACIETYDTRADRWVVVDKNFEDPLGARSYHGTAVIGTKLYFIGGFNGNDYFNTCRQFDAVKKTWKEIAPMHHKRCYVSVAVVDGYIYAMGGYDGNSRQSSVERYCIKTNQWTLITPMYYKRSDADACSLNGKIYITGGFNGHECLDSAEVYDPKTNSWTFLPSMNSRRSGVSCVAFKSNIYVIGGFNGLIRMNTGEKYDIIQKTWTPICEMHNPRSNFGLEVIDEMIMAVGGFNGQVTISECECYLPESNEWLIASSMSMIRSALTASVVKGLPNVRDYVHQNRHKLIEQKRIQIPGYDSIMSFNFDISDENSESIVSIQLANRDFDEIESENEEDLEDL
ncbi:hypothetical protein PVAND_002774 [Polypedilum vanderplanki]|uniref:Kelch-like protein diablo n=1 Tax=Polypedilum vanderplanki TaxID=319348 RepID=A0A9J6BS57_POLVA|nr:hypothetical protein PVAND_002774 [Polypedilum vanderplanki]